MGFLPLLFLLLVPSCFGSSDPTSVVLSSSQPNPDAIMLARRDPFALLENGHDQPFRIDSMDDAETFLALFLLHQFKVNDRYDFQEDFSKLAGKHGDIKPLNDLLNSEIIQDRKAVTFKRFFKPMGYSSSPKMFVQSCYP